MTQVSNTVGYMYVPLSELSVLSCIDAYNADDKHATSWGKLYALSEDDQQRRSINFNYKRNSEKKLADHTKRQSDEVTLADIAT